MNFIHLMIQCCVWIFGLLCGVFLFNRPVISPPMLGFAVDHSRLTTNISISSLRPQVSNFHNRLKAWQQREVVIWSQDYHISPVRDIKHFFAEEMKMNMRWLDWSFSGHCHLTETCNGHLLRTRSPDMSWFDLSPDIYQTRKWFFDEYKEELAEVDIFVCAFPMANCELFLPFNKSIIVIHTVPMELGRANSFQSLREWFELQNKLMSDPLTIVVSNSVYHQKYIEYFTGVTVPFMQSFCGYVRTTMKYRPERKYLIGGNHFPGGTAEVLSDTDAYLRQRGINSHEDILSPVKLIYPSYVFDDLLHHKGIVLFPYCASVMSVFEYYRLGIPLFVPSVHFLADLELRHRMSSQRIYNGFYSPHPFLPFSPNDPDNLDAIKYWLNFSDFYVLPHIVQFESAEHLAILLTSLSDDRLNEISDSMMRYSESVRIEIAGLWTDKFTMWGIGEGKRMIPTSYEREMMSRWSLMMPPLTQPSQPWPWTSCDGVNPRFGGRCGQPLPVRTLQQKQNEVL